MLSAAGERECDIMLLDFKRASLYGEMCRNAIELPRQDRRLGGGRVMGNWKNTIHGTRDALPQFWGEAVT